MESRLLRCLLVIEFLVAIEVWLTFWSEVGGQYHLDLMFWPWKFGLTLLAAGLTTAFTAEVIRAGRSRRAMFYVGMFVVVLVTAGLVTYYYHVNEPADEDEGDDSSAAQATELWQPERNILSNLDRRSVLPYGRDDSNSGRSGRAFSAAGAIARLIG